MRESRITPAGFEKYQMVEGICKLLVQAEDRRLSQIVVDANAANKKKLDISHDGFLFGGKFYFPNLANAVRFSGPGSTILHASLESMMENYEEDKAKVKEEIKLIAQCLSILLDPITTREDMRNALPDCIVELIPDLAKLPRSGPDGFTLQGRDKERYVELLDTMKFYSVARMLY